MRNRWRDVDDYICRKLLPPDPALQAARDANAAAGLPAIDVSPAQGAFLHLLARIAGAGRILEIGTLGGYSTIWLARALPPGGRLVTLEAEPRHAEVARSNIAGAGLAEAVDLRLGPALDTLPALAEGPPFDLVFVDADKAGSAAYLEWALRLSRPGTVIVLDNMVRGGDVLDASGTDAAVAGIRHAFDALQADPRLTATALQTVGAKGWDGFAVAVVS
jgi:predicted O-methyltransferase YrrM